jgi:prepilin signal peptidase PulO-like enzyme (type II secretory pathway)
MFLVLYYYSLSFVYYLICIVSIAILIIDLEYQIIPDELTWFMLFLGLLTIQSSPFTALLSAFFFSFLILVLHIITSGRGMGLGDVKLAIPIGLILGLERGIYWILTSFILGGIVASILLILKKANLKTKIAFGPFLVVGFWITVFLNRL